MENEEVKNQSHLDEFENKVEEKPKPKQNQGLQILLGVFFIGYGGFRLANTMAGDGAWNTFFGWAMIILGAIRIISVVSGK